MAFYHKYRPQLFADLVGQDHIRRILIEAVKNNRLTHAYLLAGPRGIGKTTTARLLAKAINCQGSSIQSRGEPCNSCPSCQEITDGKSLDVIEIDAASHTGVDDIREIIDKTVLAPSRSKKKVYIIDEVHMLSKSAFNALLKTLEEPPLHVIFILATTEIHKLPATILSRTQRFDFHRVSNKDIVTNLRQVALAENLDIDDQSLYLIAQIAAGGHRDALSILEQVSAENRTVTRVEVERILGLTNFAQILDFVWAIFNGNAEEGLKIAHRLHEGGHDTFQFYRNVMEALRKILLVKVCREVFVDETDENIEKIRNNSKNLEVDKIMEVMNIFATEGKLLKEAVDPLLPIEMAVIEATGKYKVSSIEYKGDKEDREGKGDNPEGSVPMSPRASEASESKDSSAILRSGRNDIALSDSAPSSITSEVWRKTIEVIKQKNTTLAALLRDAKPMTVSDQKFVLGVKFQFHKDRISEPKNRQILEKTLRDLTGADHHFVCELVSTKSIKRQPASDDDLQKAVGEVFEIAS